MWKSRTTKLQPASKFSLTKRNWDKPFLNVEYNKEKVGQFFRTNSD